MRVILLVGLLSISLNGCVSTLPPEVLTLRDAADAHIGIRHNQPENIIGNYSHRDPVDPKSWRKLNDEQSPVKGEKS